MIDMYTADGKRKNEYDWLLEYYINLSAFPVVTSTFDHLTDQDKTTLNQAVSNFSSILTEILPIVQERVDKTDV